MSLAHLRDYKHLIDCLQCWVEHPYIYIYIYIRSKPFTMIGQPWMQLDIGEPPLIVDKLTSKVDIGILLKKWFTFWGYHRDWRNPRWNHRCFSPFKLVKSLKCLIWDPQGWLDTWLSLLLETKFHSLLHRLARLRYIPNYLQPLGN